jgi:hypothetical protein
MEKLNTRLLFLKKARSNAVATQIRRGISQGDSLSPLLFCIALIPLTNELSGADGG